MCRRVYEQSMNHISLKSVLVGLPHQLHWRDQMMGGGLLHVHVGNGVRDNELV